MSRACFHGNVEPYQLGYDRCADCGERVPSLVSLVDTRVEGFIPYGANVVTR